jgi:hypothetical protein
MVGRDRVQRADMTTVRLRHDEGEEEEGVVKKDQ